MCPTFIIALRRRARGLADRRDRRRLPGAAGRTSRDAAMWAGVALAVVLCARVAVGLRVLDRRLPQRGQEGLEAIVALVAVATITWMIVVDARARGRAAARLRADAASALARGSAGALVGMAFVAVLREGFETAVFLLAAVEDATDPTARGPRRGARPRGRGRPRVSHLSRRRAARPRRASSASPGWSRARGRGPRRLGAAQRGGGGLDRRGPGPGARPRAGSSCRGRWARRLLTGVLGIQPRPAVDRGRRLGALRGPDAGVRGRAGRHPARGARRGRRPRRGGRAGRGRGRRRRRARGAAARRRAAAVVVAAVGRSRSPSPRRGARPAGCGWRPGRRRSWSRAAAARGSPSTRSCGASGSSARRRTSPRVSRGASRSRCSPARYALRCPGGRTSAAGTLVVSGPRRTAALDAGLRRGIDGYRAYLERQTATLVDRTAAFVAALRARRPRPGAPEFAWAREPYERVEPVAESFGSLDPSIDARANDVPRARWRASTASSAGCGSSQHARDGPLGRRLLRRRRPSPAAHADRRARARRRSATGAGALLGEVSTSKVTGEEDRYSHTDLSTSPPTSRARGRRSPPSGLRWTGATRRSRRRSRSASASSSARWRRHRQGDAATSPTRSAAPLGRPRAAQDIDALAEPVSRAPRARPRP